MSSSDFSPETRDQVVDVVRWALSEEEPLAVQGGGSKSGFGRAVNTRRVLGLSGLSGIRYYEPSELVLTAGAGTPLADIEDLLEENDQMLAFEPVALDRVYGSAKARGRGTVGGLVASNLAGPRRIKAGAVRDHLLGFEAVSGRGEVFKSGGKVMKNVTGFDLSKLMSGSFGTLAVMTEVTLKVLPRPEKTRTVLVYGLDDAAACRAMSEALGSPHEVSSAAHLPAGVAARSEVGRVRDPGRAVTALRIEGPEPSVLARTEAVRGMMERLGDVEELHATNSRQFWWEVAELSPFATGDESPLWRISVAPTAGPDLARRILDETGGEALFDWGGGLVTLSIPENPARAGRTVRRTVAEVGGHATLIRASETVRATLDVFQPQAPGIEALSKRVKQAFDPEGILNPGRMSTAY